MKRILSILLCLATLLGLAGCAAEDSPYVPTGDALVAEDADPDTIMNDEDVQTQVLTLVYYPDRSMHPLYCDDFTNRVLFSLMYQGLFAVSSANEPYPILCEHYTVSSDQKTFTFYLAKAKFSDGAAVTAEDVLASYEAAKESAYYKGRFTHIRSVALSEDGGITFTLDTSMESLPILLDIPIVKASQIEADMPLGTGPYRWSNGINGECLQRNESWWCSSGDLVATAQIINLVQAESPAQIRDSFEFYDVSLVCADPCSESYADYRSDFELWDCDNGIMMYLGCNVGNVSSSKGKKVARYLQNDTIRKALTYAIDRQALVDAHYRGFAKATPLAVSPSSPYYSPGLASKYSYDPVTFIAAMNSAGTPNSPLRFIVNREDGLRLRTARQIVEMLTECGLAVEMVERNATEFARDIYQNNFDLYLGQVRLSPNMDLTPFFRPWGDLSWGNISNAAIYELCQNALDNEGNFFTLHQAVAEDSKLIPIMFLGYAVYAERGLLTDLQPARDNVFFYTVGRTDRDAQDAL